MIEVIKYNESFIKSWDDFVKNSKNATFLFYRGFMDYHKNNFKDFSLIVLINGRIMALLPANIDGDSIISHGGLTYGGLILPKNIRLNTCLLIIRHILNFLFQNGIKNLLYKAIPIFYTGVPSQEEDYFFFLLQAKIFRVDTSLTIKKNDKIDYQKRRSRSIKKAKNAALNVKFDDDFTTTNFSKRSFIYNFLTTLRTRIDDPLGKKRTKVSQQ